MTNAGHSIPADQMCRSEGKNHLYSCHGEIHQETSYIKRHGPTSKHLGHIALGQYIPELVEGRHEELAMEIDYRAKQSKTAGGHQSRLNKPLPSVDAELFGFPLKALLMYQKNVFKNKDCSCMAGV